jgi:hypothetical protein
MVQAPLSYEFQDGPVIVKNNKLVPGYRCTSCEAEYYDALSVTLPLLQATLAKLRTDSNLRQPLEERIAHLTEFWANNQTIANPVQ